MNIEIEMSKSWKEENRIGHHEIKNICIEKFEVVLTIDTEYLVEQKVTIDHNKKNLNSEDFDMRERLFPIHSQFVLNSQLTEIGQMNFS